MSDYANKFLKIAVGLGVLAAGAGVGYHYGFRDQKSEQNDQVKIKSTVKKIKTEKEIIKNKIKKENNENEYYKTIEISNITRGIDSSGSSILIRRFKNNKYGGSIIICEGGCSKGYIDGSIERNILNIRWGDHREKIDLSELNSDGLAYPDADGILPEGVLYDCRNAKIGPDGARMIASTYCLNHQDYKMQKF